jgi:hypothetical protein
MLNSVYEKFVKEYEDLEFCDKVAFAEDVCKTRRMNSWVALNGYVCKKDNLAINLGRGEHYVYIWKHMYGDVFYVGKGCGKRWVTISPRSFKFYENLNKGDCVVYKIVTGISDDEAMLYERYISLVFRLAGVELVNGDNVVTKSVEETKAEVAQIRNNELPLDHIQKIEETIINKIMLDSDFAFYEAEDREHFLESCGGKYFTKKYFS